MQLIDATTEMIEKAKSSLQLTGFKSCLVTIDGKVFPHDSAGQNHAQNYVIKRGNKIAIVTREDAGIEGDNKADVPGALKLKGSGKKKTTKEGTKVPTGSSEGGLGAPPKSPEGSPSGDAGAAADKPSDEDSKAGSADPLASSDDSNDSAEGGSKESADGSEIGSSSQS
jgi:hypothetical protein